MRWRKLGLVWRPEGAAAWARTHAMLPTPWRLNERVVRVYVTCLDDKGRGRPGYVDVDAQDPARVLATSSQPLLDVGARGAFDDNGVAPLSVVAGPAGSLYLYYAGFELCTAIRYRIFTGLAVSEDGGHSFRRHARVPVLDRSDAELYFRCGTFVMRDGGRYRMWYIAGSDWTDVEGKELPVYSLKYLESEDGIRWPSSGGSAMEIALADEHGFGRPWVVQRGPREYEMYYSIRSRSRAAYRPGYARSCDGLNWTRDDAAVGLDVSPSGFDSAALMYMATIDIDGRTYCFYNGNEFGRDGFGAAELVA